MISLTVLSSRAGRTRAPERAGIRVTRGSVNCKEWPRITDSILPGTLSQKMTQRKTGITGNSAKTDAKRLVLSITRMTIHNGPGIRTLILFKGCPLRCRWCSTPESQKTEPEIAVYPDKCIHCDRCLPVCPLKAINLTEETVGIDRTVCDACGNCARECYAEAIKILGQPMTVAEIVEEVKKDAVIYRQSGGGVTISGGEPLLDPDFMVSLLRAISEEGISVGVDTCGHVPRASIERVLPWVAFLLWDIKSMNPEKHRELTGVSNELILNNLRAVSGRNIPLYIRVPLIPGYTDSDENIGAIAELARGLSSVVEVALLPLHHLGEARYNSLDCAYPIAGLPLIPDNDLQAVKRRIEAYGLKCNVGG
ncbi:glycyl-radical enzyme activating protein [Chloroflexota bacterium]